MTSLPIMVLIRIKKRFISIDKEWVKTNIEFSEAI